MAPTLVTPKYSSPTVSTGHSTDDRGLMSGKGDATDFLRTCENGMRGDLLIPLLDDSHDCETGRNRFLKDKKSASQSSVGGTTFNLCNTIVGAGVMALPHQMALLGVTLGIVFNIVLGFILYLTATAIVRACDRSGHRTYTDVVRGELGKAMGHFVQWCIILQNAGCLAIYLIIIGDVLVGSPGFEGVVPAFAGLLRSGTHSLLTCRWLVLLLVSIFFLLPLVSCRNLSGLVHASATAVVLVGAFAFIVLSLVTTAAHNGALAAISWTPDWRLAGSTSGAAAVNLMATVPTMLGAYILHMNVPPLMAELKQYTRKRMMLSARLCFVICTSLYLIISLGAYAIFGRETQADILLNFTPGYLKQILGSAASEIIGTAVAFFYVSKLILVFPLINWALRENLSDLFWGLSQPQGWRFYLITYSILVVAYVLALAVGSIEIVMDVIGCTAAMGIAVLAPGMLLFKYEWKNWGSATTAVTCFILSGVMFILGNTKIVWQLIH